MTHFDKLSFCSGGGPLNVLRNENKSLAAIVLSILKI